MNPTGEPDNWHPIADVPIEGALALRASLG